jgi:dihydroorotate dehydrogenase electron transfer subunit
VAPTQQYLQIDASNRKFNPMDYQAAEITDTAEPAPGYHLLRFSGPRRIAGDPGQFVMVRGDFGTDPILPRAFSLVEAGETGAILLRVVGKATARLAGLRTGDPLSLLGPLGNRFSQADNSRRPLLVAGGVGVAPLVFLAERLATEGHRPSLIYGARNAGELALLDRLKSAAEVTVTTEDGSAGEPGLVTAPLARALADDPMFKLFACGPTPMLAAVSRAAEAAAVPCEIALESPMACGLGTCKGCAVPGADGQYRYVCSDGPVFDGIDIYGAPR